MITPNPELQTDFYKQGHIHQYPDNTELVVTNLTARGTRVPGLTKVVGFGNQASIQHVVEMFDEYFFAAPLEEVLFRYERRLRTSLGIEVVTGHIEALHALGHLPMTFWGLPEGEGVPLRIPMLQFWNTLPEFYWVTNFLETELSCISWPLVTSATTANLFKKELVKAALETDEENVFFANFQGHDFSYRGMFGPQAAALSGMAHLTSFLGTDTIPAIDYAEHFYDANADKEMIGTSVFATEHSVMCMGKKVEELGTFRRIIEEVHPKGIVSIVSDTWNLWDVVGGPESICAKLKSIIEARDGKVVIRPDSGDPVLILCGYNANDRKQMPRAQWDAMHEYERKGVVECLFDIFGGNKNDQGFITLNEKIGAIYGDSITIERTEEIGQRLAAKGFASTNVVLGIGSFTYQGAITLDCIVTRDTHAMALKATYGVVDGEPREIFKDPITDDGTKKSAKGLIAVFRGEDGEFYAKDQATWEEVKNCEFDELWTDGVWKYRVAFSQVKKAIEQENENETTKMQVSS